MAHENKDNIFHLRCYTDKYAFIRLIHMCIYTFEPTSLYIRPVNSPQKMGFWHENIHYKRYLIVLCCVGLPVCWFCGTRKKKK